MLSNYKNNMNRDSYDMKKIDILTDIFQEQGISHMIMDIVDSIDDSKYYYSYRRRYKYAVFKEKKRILYKNGNVKYILVKDIETGDFHKFKLRQNRFIRDKAVISMKYGEEEITLFGREDWELGPLEIFENDGLCEYLIESIKSCVSINTENKLKKELMYVFMNQVEKAEYLAEIIDIHQRGLIGWLVNHFYIPPQVQYLLN